MYPSNSFDFLDGSPDLKCATACSKKTTCDYWTLDKRTSSCYLLESFNIGAQRFPSEQTLRCPQGRPDIPALCHRQSF